MHPIDIAVVVAYFIVIMAIGVYFLRRQTTLQEYFVGNRDMSAGHIGFSVVATDVGGGFSIGLGGLGFTMGLAGSWLLFTAFVTILVGGFFAVFFNIFPALNPLGEPILIALPASAVAFLVVTLLTRSRLSR